MSQVLINQYLAELDKLKKVSGEMREGIVSEAFKDLLKGWGRQHELTFVPQFKLDLLSKDKRYVDGVLLHELRVPFGYWEAKDGHDGLDAEIADSPKIVAQFKTELPAVLKGLREMIDSEQAANAAFRKAAVAFLQHGQEAINPALGEADECDARSIDIAGSSADRAERHE